jgi:hypothetical protein
MSKPLTANTITDEQIRTMRDCAWSIFATASKALGIDPNGPHDGYVSHDRRAAARAQCATILNANDRTAER